VDEKIEDRSVCKFVSGKSSGKKVGYELFQNQQTEWFWV